MTFLIKLNKYHLVKDALMVGYTYQIPTMILKWKSQQSLQGKKKAPISTLHSKSPSSSPWAHGKPTHSKGKSNEKQKRKRLPSSHQILRIDRNTTRLPNVPNVPTAGDDNKENSPIADHRKDSEGSTDAVLKQIQKTNDLLGVVAKRLDSTERHLSKMEEDIRSTKSSSSSDNIPIKPRKKYLS